MDVIVMIARWGAVAAVTRPAAAGVPDPLVPDDVEDPEATGVGDEPGRQVVAVGLVGPGRAGVDERLRVGREVAGAALAVLAAALAAPALRVVREAGLA